MPSNADPAGTHQDADRLAVQVKSLSMFMPAWNEEANLQGAIDDALQSLPELAEWFEIVVVDDGSSDGTAELVRARAEHDPRVRLESHGSNEGFGRAIRTGLAACRGELVFYTDADRQFRIADLGRLLRELDSADVVAGYRIKRNDPLHRLVVARVYHRVLSMVFDIGVRDVDCGFKLLTRRVVDTVLPQLESRSAFISPELLIRARLAGFRIVEAGVPHYPRIQGRPKGATPKVIYRTIREIVRMRRTLGAAGPQ
jgi:glycosyltransferase involved in cell wall biosynthesis